jgi:hypothetical protein
METSTSVEPAHLHNLASNFRRRVTEEPVRDQPNLLGLEVLALLTLLQEIL